MQKQKNLESRVINSAVLMIRYNNSTDPQFAYCRQFTTGTSGLFHCMNGDAVQLIQIPRSVNEDDFRLLLNILFPFIYTIEENLEFDYNTNQYININDSLIVRTINQIEQLARNFRSRGMFNSKILGCGFRSAPPAG